MLIGLKTTFSIIIQKKKNTQSQVDKMLKLIRRRDAVISDKMSSDLLLQQYGQFIV